MNQIALINPNSNAETTEKMVAIARKVDLDLVIDGFTAQRAPKLIIDKASLDASAAEVVEIARAMHGYSCVIVAAFGDPGADILRRNLPMPVIGIGAAAARRAMREGMPFAVATTTPALVPSIDTLMRANGGAAPYIGSFVPEGDAVSLMAQAEALDRALLHQIERAVHAGARQVIIGGGPLGEAAERLCGQATVPLIHPIKEAVKECIALMATKNGE
ncbi:aspartate/glutamate racemase family protein [Falsihalocynthiibacter sp. BN13B15]|uniref:aspartate/glutamate racemase family protein n=1 Tax=Falsihalocynthiibacter sp. BN13B15 TaxID=3240871 RepID=UPI003510BF9C